MRIVGTGLQLGMELNADKEGVVGKLDYLDESAPGVPAGEIHAGAAEIFDKFVVEFVAVAVAFVYLLTAVEPFGKAAVGKAAGVAAETECAADAVEVVDLILHQVYHGVLRVEIDLRGVGVRPAEDVARVFNDRYLHSEADAEIGYLVLPCIA